ncbi:MAG: lysophospholipid acyltransferase family protein [Bacteroidales bacterium]|nr:lysophospholipid acyltransferase family protein [Bacteroidales bacterium]
MYLLSDILYFVVYYLVGYRRRVVRDNLEKCFPSKETKELRRIERRYYHYLCDLLMEGGYNVFFATPPYLRHHYRLVNRQLVDRYYEQGRSVILASAHYGNWEYMVSSLNMQLLHHGIGVGKPLDDKATAAYITRRRTRYGTQVVDQTDVREHVAFFDAHRVPCALMMLGDQSPSNPHRSYWTTFLGRDTAFLYGAEYFARKYNYPVIYYTVRRVRRGYYEVEFSLLCEKPLEVPQYTVVERYVRRLEQEIMARPEYWLWSHRRWKLTREGRILKDGTLKIIKP